MPTQLFDQSGFQFTTPESPLDPLTPSSVSEPEDESVFQNRTDIRKAKLCDVEAELLKRSLPSEGAADQKRKRLMEHLFPKNNKRSKTGVCML